MEIEGKVIKIIDDYKLVINKGEKDGVKDNDKFMILEKGEELFDPDTGESLGFLEVPKLKMKVIHCQEKNSVLESDEVEIKYDVKIKKINKQSDTLSFFLGKNNIEEITEKTPHERKITLNEKKVTTGDIARKIN